MLGVDHDKIILLSTPFPTIPMLGKHCCCGVIVFYVGNKRCCIVLYCIVLYCIGKRSQPFWVETHGITHHRFFVRLVGLTVVGTFACSAAVGFLAYC